MTGIRSPVHADPAPASADLQYICVEAKMVAPGGIGRQIAVEVKGVDRAGLDTQATQNTA